MLFSYVGMAVQESGALAQASAADLPFNPVRIPHVPVTDLALWYACTFPYTGIYWNACSIISKSSIVLSLHTVQRHHC